MNPDHLPPENAAELDALLRVGVQEALATTDFAAACAAFRDELPKQAPRLAEMMPPEGARAIAFSMFREIWNHLPRPDHDWKTLPLPKLERNAPCPCGSGLKYKQCCGSLADASPFGPGEFSVLAYVLETVPVSQYRALPFKRLNPDELAHVAQQWLDDGRMEAAAALLEPLLAPDARLDLRHEYAFDTLCDIYLEMDQPARRIALVERLMQSSDRDLKSAAMHRRCTMLADAGDYPAAWRLFKDAQRQDPDNPGLAHLELVLLASQGEIDQAQQRARFWATRLRKLGYEGEEIVAYMEQIARDPQALIDAMQGGNFADVDAADDADFEEADIADVEALITLAETLPAPSCQHRLFPRDGQAGPLTPTPELAALESKWQDLFPRDAAERDPWRDTRWLLWLAAHPLAWQSFIVLDDLAMSLDDSLFPEVCDDPLDWLEETLLDHAVALLRVNIAANRAENCRLEWGCRENRPALRLVMRLADLAQGTDEELPLLEWLVLTLNPDDNTGHRVALVHRLCEAGRAAAALAVCDRHADDTLGGMRYGRVLALQQLDRCADATAALAQAKKSAPRMLKTLVADKPRMPAITPGTITPGGADEAWYYRADFLTAWEKTGALAWLRRVVKDSPRS